MAKVFEYCVHVYVSAPKEVNVAWVFAHKVFPEIVIVGEGMAVAYIVFVIEQPELLYPVR